jgi:preprotein translocase subunit SecG
MKWTLVIISLVLHSVWSATDEETEEQKEAKANRVEAAVYLLTKAKWDTEVRKEFIDLVVEEANKKCASKPEDCGLRYWNETPSEHGEFKVTDFELAEGSPAYVKPYLNVSYALRFPKGVELVSDPKTKYYLMKSALQDVSKQMQPKLVEKTGYRILKMDTEQYKLPPNQNLNIIMCVIAVALFGICVILIFVLRYTCSHAHKPEPVVKVTVDPPENKEDSTKDGLQNTGV